MAREMPITSEGMDKLKEELDHLIKVEREILKKQIQEAREHGDLKENAEYHAAKEKQSITEGKISNLQGTIANSNVIDVKSIKSDKIVFGATVGLIDENGKKITYQIVGQTESDIKNGKISFNSPLGTSLIGKEEGDLITVKAPKGDVEYEIEYFKYI